MSKPARSAKRMGDPGGGLAVFAVAYLLFLYVPVLLLPIFSFNDSIFTAFPLKGFTTKWYSQAFADDDMLRSLVASLQVGAIVAVASTILGLFGAKAVTRYRMPGQGAITGLIMLPLFVPEIVLGIALLILVNNLDLELSLITIGVVIKLDGIPAGPMIGAFVRPLLACAVMAAAVLGARHGLQAVGVTHPAALVPIEIAVGAAAYVPAAFLFARPIARDFLAQLKRALKRGG